MGVSSTAFTQILSDLMTEMPRYKTYVSYLCGLMLIMFAHTGSANAQGVTTNTDHAMRLIAAAADSVLKASNVQGYRLSFDYDYPVRIKLIERLFFMGHKVYENTTENTEIATLNVDARLTYRFIGDKNESTRTVVGTIGITLTQSDGSITATYVRQIDERHPVMAKPGDLDDGVWPMVSFASIEYGGRRKVIKRILEPALIVTTAAVTIFLLFNVRSQ